VIWKFRTNHSALTAVGAPAHKASLLGYLFACQVTKVNVVGAMNVWDLRAACSMKVQRPLPKNCANNNLNTNVVVTNVHYSAERKMLEYIDCQLLMLLL